MAGSQEAMASEAGRKLWQARQDLEEARRAPHTGSASNERLRNAQAQCNQAASAFDNAYTEYSTSMRNAKHTPRDKSSFITR